MWGWEDKLAALESRGLRREAVPLEPVAPFRARLWGREVRVFCSNDYLALSRDPAVLRSAHEALERYGPGSGSARQVAGDLPPHRELEDKIALFLGTESALLFSSGYLANLGTIPALVREGDWILSDERNHASLIDACRLSRAQTVVYRHADPEDLRQKLASCGGKGRRLVVTESLFSMDGDLAPLREVLALRREFDFALYLDEAHALGTLGFGGRGAVEALGIPSAEIEFRMGTLSKALASQGAFVAGSRAAVEYLRSFARTHLFETALAPAAAAAAGAAIDRLREEPSLPVRLQERSRAFRRSFSGIFGETGEEVGAPILPIRVGDPKKTMEFSRWLLERGAYVQGIRPPTVPEDASRLRLTVTLGHSSEDLEWIGDLLEEGAAWFLLPSR